MGGISVLAVSAPAWRDSLSPRAVQIGQGLPHGSFRLAKRKSGEGDERAVSRRIASHVRVARALRGLSQRELGDLIGVSYQQIHKYENGRTNLTVGRLCRISQALGMPLSFFVGDFDVPPSSLPKSGSGRIALLQAYRHLNLGNRGLIISISQSLIESQNNNTKKP